MGNNLSEILAKLGIGELNPMQQDAMNHILRGRNDVVVLSPTGTGKTLAYLLPLYRPWWWFLDENWPCSRMVS